MLKQNALSQGAITSAFAGTKNGDKFLYGKGEINTVQAGRDILYVDTEVLGGNTLLKQVEMNTNQSFSTNDIQNVISRNISDLLSRDARTQVPYLLVAHIVQLLVQYMHSLLMRSQLQSLDVGTGGYVSTDLLYSSLFSLSMRESWILSFLKQLQVWLLLPLDTLLAMMV